MARGARVSLAAERPAPRHYGHDHTANIRWDCTDAPGSNKDKKDRIRKLGHYWQTWGAAITVDDLETKTVKVPDGMLVGGDIRSNFPPDPDGEVLRLHEKRSRGRENMWTSRLQVEHRNDAQKRNHKSTLWIDQCDEQNQAWSLDPFWIVRLGAEIIDDELQFTNDGFLRLLCGGGEDPGPPNVPTPGRSRPNSPAVPTPSRGRRRPGSTVVQQLDDTDPGVTAVEDPPLPKRGVRELGALAFNIGKRAGIITDGGPIAALWHILHIHPGRAIEPGRCAPEKQQQGALRGDVNFSMTIKRRRTTAAPAPPGGGGQPGGPGSTVVQPLEVDEEDVAVLAHLAIHDPPSDPEEHDEQIVKGHLYIDDPHPRPPKREMNIDPISPQPILKRDLESGIHVWIGLPSILASASIINFMSVHIRSLAESQITSAFGSLGYSPEEPPKSQYSPGRTGSVVSGVFSVDLGSTTATPGSGTNRAVTGNDGFGGAGPDEVETSGAEPIGLNGGVVDFSQLGN